MVVTRLGEAARRRASGKRACRSNARAVDHGCDPAGTPGATLRTAPGEIRS
jgi:hypothetical protein